MMSVPSINTLSRDLDMLRIEEDLPPGAEMSMVLPDLDRLRLVQEPPAGAEISMVLPGLDRLRLVEHSTAGGEDVFVTFFGVGQFGFSAVPSKFHDTTFYGCGIMQINSCTPTYHGESVTQVPGKVFEW